MAKEYIEREAIIDEINSAPVSMSICMNVDECKGRIYERERLVRIINEATAADVVARDCYDRLLAENDRLRKERPVVRCGECKHCVEHYDTDGNAPYWVCKEWDSGTDYDGYCHYGEKKGL